MGRARAYVGCSGWNYDSWRRTFYPQELPPSRWLRHYAAVFDTVEVNGTFYKLPESATFAAWREQTPSGFCLAVKASRYLTHLKRLRKPAAPLTRLLTRVKSLGPRLGPLLFQLPPNLPLDLPRLETFLAAWTARRKRWPAIRAVVEFRHASWYVDETFELLRAHDVAVCLHDKTEGPYEGAFTGPFMYVRFHGTSGHYKGSYSARRLSSWASRLAERLEAGDDVFAYFNNDPGATAPRNALVLRDQLAARAPAA